MAKLKKVCIVNLDGDSIITDMVNRERLIALLSPHFDLADEGDRIEVFERGEQNG
jgi:hypothetical protein